MTNPVSSLQRPKPHLLDGAPPLGITPTEISNLKNQIKERLVLDKRFLRQDASPKRPLKLFLRQDASPKRPLKRQRNSIDTESNRTVLPSTEQLWQDALKGPLKQQRREINTESDRPAFPSIEQMHKCAADIFHELHPLPSETPAPAPLTLTSALTLATPHSSPSTASTLPLETPTKQKTKKRFWSKEELSQLASFALSQLRSQTNIYTSINWEGLTIERDKKSRQQKYNSLRLNSIIKNGKNIEPFLKYLSSLTETPSATALPLEAPHPSQSTASAAAPPLEAPAIQGVTQETWTPEKLSQLAVYARQLLPLKG